MAQGVSGFVEFNSNTTWGSMRVYYSQEYNSATNTSIVSITKIQSKTTSWHGFVWYLDGIISVNGTPVVVCNSSQGANSVYMGDKDIWYDCTNTSGSIVVNHKDDGSADIVISIGARRYNNFYFHNDSHGHQFYISNGSERCVSLTTIPTYTLSVFAGVGSSIIVNRTSSGYHMAKIGIITHDTKLYYGDMLKITFTPNANYRLLSTTVNGALFTSNNTHTVMSDVEIISTAQVLASSIGASDANIGSTSIITVAKSNISYYHSLRYSFGDLSGYISSTGDIQDTEVKFQETSIAFRVPTLFYTQIPNTNAGTCTIYCYTYDSSSSTTHLGDATECTFTAIASPTNCSPILSASVIDTNSVTKGLTGDESVLIRYKSTAQCSINATSRNSASIRTVCIDGDSVNGVITGNTTIVTKSFENTHNTLFRFSATDSRGYSAETIVTPTVVAYVKLTCNPEITRPTPTGSNIVMSFTGNVYRGSFGAYSNTLTIKYRYKEEGGSYGQWREIDSTNIVFGASTYRSSAAITLPEEFDYTKSYEFQIQASDGADGYVLSTATSTISVQQGVPVFDWGKNSLNVNVSFMLNNVNILDIMYPVGTVYMHSTDILPDTIYRVGKWVAVDAGTSGTYAWVRTE